MICLIVSRAWFIRCFKDSDLQVTYLRIPATNDNLPVHEEKNRGVYVKGLLEVYVSSVEEIYEVLRRGGQARIVSCTSMYSNYCYVSSCLCLCWANGMARL